MIKYVSAADSPFVLAPSQQTQQLPLQPVYVVVDSSGGSVEILLPSVASYPVKNLQIFITDSTGQAATNNITAYATGSDKINGESSIAISNNYGSLRIQIGADGLWTADQGQSPSPVSDILEYQVTVPAARVIELLNAGDTENELIIAPPGAANKTIQLVTANMGVATAGTRWYNGTPQRFVLCSSPTDLRTTFFSTSLDDIAGNFSGIPAPFYFKMVDKYVAADYAGSSPLQYANNGVYLRGAAANAGVTDGDTDFVFFGLYRIKTWT